VNVLWEFESICPFPLFTHSGKYVPSIAHYILQLDATAKGHGRDIKHPREIPQEDIHEPNFQLGGMAIGNGFTGEGGDFHEGML